MDKIVASAADAVADIGDGASLAVGGFGLSGIPWVLLEALLAQGATDLSVASNNCGVDGAGLGLLLGEHRIKRVIASYVGENKEFARQFLAGELEVELTPQGTLAERMRAGGAGIGAFFTPTGVGTQVAEGGLPWRYRRRRQRRRRVAAEGDPRTAAASCRSSRSRSSPTSRSFGPRWPTAPVISSSTRPPATSTRNAAMCGRITIVEAERVVDVGAIDPDRVHLPGIFVHRVVALTPEQANRKDIEKRTTRPRPGGAD